MAYVTLADLVRHQAEAQPKKSALRDQTQEKAFTYSQIDQLIDAIASQLQTQGINHDAQVMVYLSRDYQQIIIMLALWRLGATYIPQDVTTPSSRLQAVMKKLKPEWILTSAKLHQTIEIPELSDDQKQTVVEIDELDFSLENAETLSDSQKNFPVVTEDTIAYIIYTSGSTGEPQPIPICHRGISYWSEKVLENKLGKKMAELHHVLENTSCAADPQIWNVLVAVTFGKCLHMSNDETRINSHKLIEFILERDIDVALLVPTQIGKIIPLLKSQSLPLSLKILFSTGEALTKGLCKTLFDLGVETIVNAYGPSQTTFGASIELITQEDLAHYENEQMPIALPEKPVRFLLKPDGYDEPVDCQTFGDSSVSGELFIETPYITPAPQFSYSEGVFQPGDRMTMESGKLYFEARTGELVKIKGVTHNLNGLAEIVKATCQDVTNAYCSYDSKQHVLFVHVETTETNRRIMNHRIQNAFAQAGYHCLPTVPFCYPKFPEQVMGKANKTQFNERQEAYSKSEDLTLLEGHPPNLLVESEIRELVLQHCDVNVQIGIDTVLWTLGFTSLHLSELCRKIEQKFKVIMDIPQLIKEPLTIQRLAEMVFALRANANVRGGLVIPEVEISIEKPAIVVFPDITGNQPPSLVPELIKTFSSSFSIVTLGARGLKETANMADVTSSLKQQALDYVNVLNQLLPNVELFFVGWSYGALLAVAAAIEYEKINQSTQIKAIAIIDEAHPFHYQRMSVDDFSTKVSGILTSLGFQADSRGVMEVKEKRMQSANEEHVELIKQMINPMESKVNTDKLRQLQVLKANLLAAQLVEFSSIRDVKFFIYLTDALREQVQKNDGYWDEVIDGQFTVCPVHLKDRGRILDPQVKDDEKPKNYDPHKAILSDKEFIEKICQEIRLSFHLSESTLSIRQELRRLNSLMNEVMTRLSGSPTLPEQMIAQPQKDITQDRSSVSPHHP